MGKVQKRKLSDEVINEILRMIKDQGLKAGDKLPNQTEFAESLGVSRTSLREALSKLTVFGILEQRQGSGTIIKSRIPSVYSDNIIPPLISNPKTTVDLIEARKLIETGTVELAAINATPEQLEKIGALIEEMKIAIEAGLTDEYSEKDIAFHLLIADASMNNILSYILATIRTLMEEFMYETSQHLPNLHAQSLEHHTMIYKAVKERKPEEAKRLMKEHISTIQEVLLRYYGDKEIEVKS